MRVSWTLQRSLMLTSVAILALQGSGVASAQFVPYVAQNQQQPYAAQPGYGNAQQQYAQQQFAQQQQLAQQQFAQQQYAQQQQFTQQQPFAQQQAPQYTAMAFQGGQNAGSADILPAAAEAVPQSANGAYAPPANGAAAKGGYGQAGATPSYESYPPAGRSTGAYGAGSYNYNTFENCDNSGSCGYGNFGMDCCPKQSRRWFGGIYGLLMERTNGGSIPLAFTTTMPGTGIYPANSEIVLNTGDLDTGYQEGAEIRFGSTLNCFGGGDACGPRYAWEAAYWGLAEESETRQINDVATFGTDGNRTYGMIDFRGLEYQPSGGSYRSVNHYYDYGPPTTDNTVGPMPDIEIRYLTARSTFSAQNAEINLLRLPVLSGGCCSGCDAGGSGTGQCGLGRRAGGSYCGPRYSLTTLVGARYMRFDEDFYLRSDFDVIGGSSGYLAYNVEADNDLFGLQLGCNGIYHLGCAGRFALHCTSAVGLYGNRMSVSQRMDSTGTVRFANGTNANFNTNYSKDDVAMIGELRLGGSCRVGSKCRLYGGWRVVGITGVALSTNQIPTAFTTPEQVGTINSNGSLILHGIQAGAEWTY